MSEFECEIPEVFNAAFDRALLVLGSELDKLTKVFIEGKKVHLLSSSGVNEVRDQMSLGVEMKEREFYTAPELVSRGLKVSRKICFMPNVLVMHDEAKKFTHLIAHLRA